MPKNNKKTPGKFDGIIFYIFIFQFLFAAILAFAVADPIPEAKAEPKPGFITTYGAPFVAPAFRYSDYRLPWAYPEVSRYVASPYYGYYKYVY